jgi:hypothetical protein
LHLEGQNREFEIDIIADGQSLSQSADGYIEGKIDTDAIELEFKIRSSEVGTAMAYFYVEIEDGPPITFQC